MVEDYTIDKGLAVPPSRQGRKLKYPWNEMEPGDSILVKTTENMLAARVAAFKYAKKHGLTFVSRSSNKGLRIWRTK